MSDVAATFRNEETGEEIRLTPEQLGKLNEFQDDSEKERYLDKVRAENFASKSGASNPIETGPSISAQPQESFYESARRYVRDPVSPVGAYLRNVPQGALGEYTDETVGALRAGESAIRGENSVAGSAIDNLLYNYRLERDKERIRDEIAMRENPVPSILGKLTGALVFPGPGKVKGLAGAAKAAAKAASIGAVYGSGASQADVPSGEVSRLLLDAAKGAGVSGAMTVGAMLLGKALTPAAGAKGKLSKPAQAAIGSTGLTLKQSKLIAQKQGFEDAEKFARWMYENGYLDYEPGSIVGAVPGGKKLASMVGASQNEMAEKLLNRSEEYISNLNKAIEEVDSLATKAERPTGIEVASAVEQLSKQKKYATVSGESGASAIEEFAAKLREKYGNKKLTLSQLEQEKRNLYNEAMANWDRIGPLPIAKQAQKDVSLQMMREGEKFAEKASAPNPNLPNLSEDRAKAFADFLRAKKESGYSQQLLDYIGKYGGPRPLSRLQSMGTLGALQEMVPGLASGQPLTAAASVAKAGAFKAMMDRGLSTYAKAGYKLQELAAQNSNRFGRFANLAYRAAMTSPDEFAKWDFQMAEKDPEYRQLRNQLLESRGEAETGVQ